MTVFDQPFPQIWLNCLLGGKSAFRIPVFKPMHHKSQQYILLLKKICKYVAFGLNWDSIRQTIIQDRFILLAMYIQLPFRKDWIFIRCDYMRWNVLLSIWQVLCEGNPPVTGRFPWQKPVMQNLNAFFVVRLNNILSKQWCYCWFKTPWWSCNAMTKTNFCFFFLLPVGASAVLQQQSNLWPRGSQAHWHDFSPGGYGKHQTKYKFKILYRPIYKYVHWVLYELLRGKLQRDEIENVPATAHDWVRYVVSF